MKSNNQPQMGAAHMVQKSLPAIQEAMRESIILTRNRRIAESLMVRLLIVDVNRNIVPLLGDEYEQNNAEAIISWVTKRVQDLEEPIQLGMLESELRHDLQAALDQFNLN